MDADLLARAVKAGLVLLPCPTCERTGECRCPMCVDDDPYPEPCPACDGTGEDRTPWGFVGAVRMCSDSIDIRRDRVVVSMFDVVGAHHGDAEHDGTPEGIRDAALTAFCRAREAT